MGSYLLSSSHPIGRNKARFFKGFGFGEHAPDELVQALLEHVRTHDVADAEINPLLVKPAGEGVVAVDGLLVLQRN